MSSNRSTPMPVYETEESRFKSDLPTGHPHLSYSKPIHAGQAWRINAYAGDQAKRFAASLPNRGVNRFAGAFSTAPASSGFTTAASLGTAQTAECQASSHKMEPLSAAGFQRAGSVPAFSSARAALSQMEPTASASTTFTGSVNRPFKAPSMAKPTNGTAHHVATVETRLTQQQRGVILNPLPPKAPQSGQGYSLPSDRDDSFAYLRGLVKDEGSDIAPRRPTPPKKRSSNSVSGAGSKRSKQ